MVFVSKNTVENEIIVRLYFMSWVYIQWLCNYFHTHTHTLCEFIHREIVVSWIS